MGVRYGSLEKCISVSTPISDWNRVIRRLNRLRYKYRTFSMQLEQETFRTVCDVLFEHFDIERHQS